MEIAITIAIALVGGVCALAFADLAAFKRLMRFSRPIANFSSYVALGMLIATVSIKSGTGTGQMLDVVLIILAGSAGWMILLGFLLWLREGLSGFSDL